MTPATEAILALVSGYSYDERMRRLLVILQPAIDDSGRGDGPVFVLAGFVMSVYMWTVFADKWRAVLDMPPRIEYFKMKEAEHFCDQFSGFSVTERDDKIRKLVSLIMDYQPPLAIRHVTPHEAYERCFGKKFAKKTDYPYFLSYFGVIGTVLQYQVSNEWHLNDKLDFVFDEQGAESDFIQSKWANVLKIFPADWKGLIGARPDHRDDKTFLPLQAADLYAWHVRRSYWEQSQGKEFENANWKRLNSLRYVQTEWSEERLRGLSDSLRTSGLVFEHDLKTRRQRKTYKKILRGRDSE